MRLFSFVLLVIALAATAIFAIENDGPVTIQFWNWHWSTQLALLIGGIYLLGMFSGWFVVGMFRRSIHRITERE